MKITPTSYSGYKYLVVYTDDFTSFRLIDFTKSKDEVFETVKDRLEYLKHQFGTYPNIIRIDNGTEFKPVQLEKFLKSKGIIYEPSNRYTPEQNGIAERSNRAILDKGRTVIIDSNILKYL